MLNPFPTSHHLLSNPSKKSNPFPIPIQISLHFSLPSQFFHITIFLLPSIPNAKIHNPTIPSPTSSLPHPSIYPLQPLSPITPAYPSFSPPTRPYLPASFPHSSSSTLTPSDPLHLHPVLPLRTYSQLGSSIPILNINFFWLKTTFK